MIQKYFSILVILTSIAVVSCRQDNELNTGKEEINTLQKEFNRDSMTMRPDSVYVGFDPNDPPKNGTHYRFMDSLSITNPPKNGTHYKLKDSLDVPGEITNPPKNGTHYKFK